MSIVHHERRGPADEDRVHAETDIVNGDKETVQPVSRHLVAEPAGASGDLLAQRQTLVARDVFLIHIGKGKFYPITRDYEPYDPNTRILGGENRAK